jgi:hypothetical protein
MEMLKTQIKNFLVSTGEARTKQKKAFWCTESEANQFDVYHSFKGTPPSNPMTPETAFSLGMRTKLEQAVVEIFDKMKILVPPEPYKNSDGEMVDGKQWRVEMERLGVPVVGYMDAIIEEESVRIPVEIKTSYGLYSKNELMQGIVKSNYMKQLCQYMDFMGANKGYLFVINFEKDLIIDDIYQFVIVREGDIYRCNNQVVNLVKEVYERYQRIWLDYIVPDIEPKSEFIYKYPIQDIDWKNTPKSKISLARNNKAVIGDWQVKYSGYKDLIIEKEGCGFGYSDEEIEYIKQQTKGFTTWNKN